VYHATIREVDRSARVIVEHQLSALVPGAPEHLSGSKNTTIVRRDLNVEPDVSSDVRGHGVAHRDDPL
jgi:hypothetical protein